MSEHISIVGAGLAGSLLACDLARMGFEVKVFERRPDPRERGFIGGRSINLALSTRGLTALDRVGLADRILADAIRMPGRIMHSPNKGDPIVFQPYSSNPEEAINSVSRAGLNMVLIEAAAQQGVRFHFSHRCGDVDLAETEGVFIDGNEREVRDRPALLVGADGAYSAVRMALQQSGAFTFSQSYLEHGYKELTIPPVDHGFARRERDESLAGRETTPSGDGPFAINPHGLHIWPRGGAMMIALPNPDGSFTCTLFWPKEGDGIDAHSFARVDGQDDAGVVAFFERWYPDAVPLMPTLVEDYRQNPVGALVTMRCSPWHVGRTLLVGDASHAIVPFFGQGMNAAFEDCRVLAEMIESSGLGGVESMLEEFSERRKPNGDAIADMALDNFIEMRDKVGSKAFLLKKKGEKVLHRLFPSRFVPLYNLVSFSNVPYAEAKQRAERNGMLLRSAAIVPLFLVLLVLGGLRATTVGFVIFCIALAFTVWGALLVGNKLVPRVGGR